MSPVAGNDASAKTNAMSAAQRRNHCVISDLFAYRLAHGVIPRPGWSGAEDAVICHQCDFRRLHEPCPHAAG